MMEQLSNVAFKFKLRRYTEGIKAQRELIESLPKLVAELNEVGRCRLTLSNPY
jgi:hypothetical protein